MRVEGDSRAAAGPDLDRFLEAQDAGGTYAAALAELRAGRKRSHWMWFVFPQIEGLGRSPTAHHYAIASPAEARAYLAHPVLGPRLRESAAALLALDGGDDGSRDGAGGESDGGAGTGGGADPAAILGPVDALKLRSSMTLFAHADPAEPLFPAVLERFYGGEPDPATLALL